MYRALKIYFAGSIRSGRQDSELHSLLIEKLKRYGEVLTEHVGDPKTLSRGEALPDERIYGRDMEWLEEADCVVAEVTSPSLGVGYEITRAESLGKPILCLYRPGVGRTLSAMVAGSRKATIFEYAEIGDVDSALEAFLKAS